MSVLLLKKPNKEALKKDWGKYFENRICYTDLPGIINNKLLNDILKQQLEKTEYGKLTLQENGVLFEKVREISIEFQKILRIDHLWMLTNLKILKLGNNCIEKIQNLESLIQLTVLDLSFNKIEKIENLSTLKNLENLSLFDNSISLIENLEGLHNLTIFSIGRNKIADWSNIIYLKKLPALKSLNMVDNPCTLKENFKYFTIRVLPHLIYYEYKSITDIERKIGDEIFQSDSILEIVTDMEETEKIKLRKMEEEDEKVQEDSFVEYLNTRSFFESLFENDEEGSNFLLIGENVKTLYVTYEKNICALCKDIFLKGKENYYLRQEEINGHKNCVSYGIEQSRLEGISNMEKFVSIKSELVNEIEKIQKQRFVVNLDNQLMLIKKIMEIKKTYNECSATVWKMLMKSESNLNESITELNETFERNLTDLIINFAEQAQGMFSRMRDIVTEHNDNLNELALGYYNNAIREEEEAVAAAEKLRKELIDSKSVSTIDLRNELEEIKVVSKVPVELKPYLVDRDTLANAVAASKDVHLFVIDNREDVLVTRAKDWLQELVRTMNVNEIKRNRDKVVEINHFLKIHKDELLSSIKNLESVLDTALTPSTSYAVGR